MSLDGIVSARLEKQNQPTENVDAAKRLASEYVEHITNEEGDVMANVYESEAFKRLYDPFGLEARKLRLPRRQLYVYNK